ncbi:MAG: hypothetical protein ABIH21_01315 [Patescibacteria group bacterium]
MSKEKAQQKFFHTLSTQLPTVTPEMFERAGQVLAGSPLGLTDSTVLSMRVPHLITGAAISPKGEIAVVCCENLGEGKLLPRYTLYVNARQRAGRLVADHYFSADYIHRIEYPHASPNLAVIYNEGGKNFMRWGNINSVLLPTHPKVHYFEDNGEYYAMIIDNNSLDLNPDEAAAHVRVYCVSNGDEALVKNSHSGVIAEPIGVFAGKPCYLLTNRPTCGVGEEGYRVCWGTVCSDLFPEPGDFIRKTAGLDPDGNLRWVGRSDIIGYIRITLSREGDLETELLGAEQIFASGDDAVFTRDTNITDEVIATAFHCIDTPDEPLLSLPQAFKPTGVLKVNKKDYYIMYRTQPKDGEPNHFAQFVRVGRDPKGGDVIELGGSPTSCRGLFGKHFVYYRRQDRHVYLRDLHSYAKDRHSLVHSPWNSLQIVDEDLVLGMYITGDDRCTLNIEHFDLS